MSNFFRKLVRAFLAIEHDPARLAFTTTLGLFIGFSPFLGFQTPLVFILGYFFQLPVSILFSVVYVVNNPFLTTFPIIIANYLTGYVFFTYIIPCDVYAYNPIWFNWIEKKIAPWLSTYLHIERVSFWYFLGGGVIFAILFSVPFYPLFKCFYTKLAHEDYSAK